jgi:hypothetical protein
LHRQSNSRHRRNLIHLSDKPTGVYEFSADFLATNLSLLSAKPTGGGNLIYRSLFETASKLKRAEQSKEKEPGWCFAQSPAL